MQGERMHEIAQITYRLLIIYFQISLDLILKRKLVFGVLFKITLSRSHEVSIGCRSFLAGLFLLLIELRLVFVILRQSLKVRFQRIFLFVDCHCPIG